jgi:hypothetical protein
MNRIIIIAIICLSFISCKKKETKKNLSERFNTDGATLISQSNFSSNAHPTSGCVRLYSKNGAKELVFAGFKTDKGPDLRVYFSKSANNSDIIEVGILKATSGDFSYKIENAVNTNDYKYILIWCEDFSVLFGNAQL